MAVDQGLGLVGHWLAWLLALILSLFAAIEGVLRHAMAQLHLPGQIQSIVLVLLTIVLIVLAVRVFGGLFRLLLMVFLVLLLIHIVMAGHA